jgi:ribonucleotide reductase, class II
MTKFPSGVLGNVVAFRTYFRRMVTGLIENWDAVCDRTIPAIARLGKFTPEEEALVYDMQLQLKTLTSGRWLWVGGTEWVLNPKNYSGAYNCFQGDTLVTTKEYGSQKIRDLVGLNAHILTEDASWEPVVFKSYGDQELVELSLKRVSTGGSGVLTNILTTPNHSWITQDGGRLPTSSLVAGQKIPFVCATRPSLSSEQEKEDYRKGAIHGIVYGDGSVQGSKSNSSRTNFKVRLCKEKAKLLSYFGNSCRTIYCPSYLGDPLVFVRAEEFADYVESGNLKALPTTNNTSYLLGFFRGLLATDGSISAKKNSITSCICGKRQTIDWLLQICPILGVEIVSTRLLYKEGQDSNLGKRKTDTWGIYFFSHSLVEDDFMRLNHKELFRLSPHTKFEPFWKVLDVQETGIVEEVFCCEEPRTHSFVLTGGLLTGNCSGQGLRDWTAFATVMNLAMMGCGTGVDLEDRFISQLPVIRNKLNVSIVGEIGAIAKDDRQEETITSVHYPPFATGEQGSVRIVIGDSRGGWVEAYRSLLELSSNITFKEGEPVLVEVVVSNVRPAGEPLVSFGGTANPAKLPDMFVRVAKILNKAVGRKLNSIECCLIVDEAAIVVVAGNIRRSSGIRQFAEDDELGTTAKDNLWIQDGNGNWSIDPDRDALRMANHSRVYHHKPSWEDTLASVRKQHGSGEGAIQYAPEAIARGNADLLDTEEKRLSFIDLYVKDDHGGRIIQTDSLAAQYLSKLNDEKYGYSFFENDIHEEELEHRLSRYQLNPLVLAA